MGWAIGYVAGRDVGYGVPAVCEHPKCDKKIDRGLSYVCGHDIGGGENGCGLFFCENHLSITIIHEGADEEEWSPSLCENCLFNFELSSIEPYEYDKYKQPFEQKDDVPMWKMFKLTDSSWSKWRSDEKEEAKAIKDFFKLNPELEKQAKSELKEMGY